MSQINRLAIGAAKFGFDYDYLNNTNSLSKKTAYEILDTANNFNINTIDTAQGYGNSEQVIGDYVRKRKIRNLNIITKVSQGSNDIDIQSSLEKLNVDSLYGVLIHDFSGFKKDKSIFYKLLEYKDEGLINKIGFSLYYPEELEYLLESKIKFDIVQVGYSIFDQRFKKYFAELKNMGIEIHTRSAFLHGLYFKEVDDLGLHFNSVKDKLKSLQQLSLSKKLPVEAICLGYVLHEPNIDKIIIGVDSSELLIKNIKLINNINIESDDFCDLSDYSVQNINILFPHHWKI
jgi:aryl-alcohol dehydrogenase-like predicted oxidoreductase